MCGQQATKNILLPFFKSKGDQKTFDHQLANHLNGDQNWPTIGDRTCFNRQKQYGPVVTKPLFGHHPMTLCL